MPGLISEVQTRAAMKRFRDLNGSKCDAPQRRRLATRAAVNARRWRKFARRRARVRNRRPRHASSVAVFAQVPSCRQAPASACPAFRSEPSGRASTTRSRVGVVAVVDHVSSRPGSLGSAAPGRGPECTRPARRINVNNRCLMSRAPAHMAVAAAHSRTLCNPGHRQFQCRSCLIRRSAAWRPLSPCTSLSMRPPRTRR